MEKSRHATFQEGVNPLDHPPIMPPFIPYLAIYLDNQNCNFVAEISDSAGESIFKIIEICLPDSIQEV
jgi:hypothetical protein